MMATTIRTMCVLALAGIIGSSNLWAAELTDHGRNLEAKYAEQLESLKAEIKKALPEIDQRKREDYFNAREDEKAAEAELAAAQNRLGQIAGAAGSVNHAKNKWIAGADRGIKAAEEKLKNAATEAEREAARQELAKWQANKADGIAALNERQQKLDELKQNEAQWNQERDAAEEALAEAKADTIEALNNLGLQSLISSDKLDGKLAKFVVLFEATPKGLAEFAQQSKDDEALVEQLLADQDLMRQMVVADGANAGKYGQAMKIYRAIQKASNQAGDGPLQRLALAISLEHAVPIGQRNPTGATDAPEHVDPVNRYLHYQKAFLNGELDPAFKDLSAWDYRMVVDGNEPDETLLWGREMLRSYRPDHITNPDHRWRYVGIVRTDVRYGSQYNKYDKPELQFFQNILMNGGICGRRAFIGRFILRAFGIPTTARPQRGHGALVRWTPDGWVPVLGAGWGSGWTHTRYDRDRDFLANTQARENPEAFMQVKRAQWIGDVMGEKRVFGLHSGNPDFWYGAALYRQRAIIAEDQAAALAAVGEELAEANESEVEYAIKVAAVTEKDRQISVATNGVITIPAAASSNPTESTGKIIFMPSNLGGMQLHYSRGGAQTSFEYTVDAPAAGKYALAARVASPSWGQLLMLDVNGAGEPIRIELPLTVGLWDHVEPVEVELAKGKNVLTFSRDGDNIRGLTIKDFTLTPQ